MTQLVCSKQPILDQKNQVFSYFFQLQSLGKDKNSQLDEETLHLFSAIFNIEGSAFLNKNLCFYKAPIDFLRTDLLPPIENKENLVMEIPIACVSNAKALSNLKSVRALGVQFCLDDYDGSEGANKLLSICSYAKINPDRWGSDQKVLALKSALETRNITPILMNIDTEESQRHYQALGFGLFQGYFFTNPIITENASLSANHLSLVRLMGQINDPDTDFATLSDIISRDVGLSHKLLTAINHPSNNLPIYVDSINTAVKYMGLRRLKFWVNMMVLSNMDDSPRELMVTSLVRAKFLENLAENTQHKVEKDAYFLVGLFSTLNAFFRTSMIDIIEELPLSDKVKSALIDLKGAMGEALHTVKQLEQGSTDLQSIKFEDQGIMEISMHYMKSNAWAHQILDSL